MFGHPEEIKTVSHYVVTIFDGYYEGKDDKGKIVKTKNLINAKKFYKAEDIRKAIKECKQSNIYPKCFGIRIVFREDLLNGNFA